jgi:dUTP pyrophosphatase
MAKVKVEVINKSDNGLPKYETNGSAGADVRADFSRITPELPIKAFGNCQFVFKSDKCPVPYFILDPGCRALIPTGLFVAIPEGWEIRVQPRSGLALKKGISCVNTPGCIDSDYRNEIGVILINHGLEPVVIEHGERIAQLILSRVDQIEWEPVEVLDETSRLGGFGSTGVN